MSFAQFKFSVGLGKNIHVIVIITYDIMAAEHIFARFQKNDIILIHVPGILRGIETNGCAKTLEVACFVQQATADGR